MPPAHTGPFQAPHTSPKISGQALSVCMTSVQNNCSVIIATIVNLCILVPTHIFVCFLKLQQKAGPHPKQLPHSDPTGYTPVFPPYTCYLKSQLLVWVHSSLMGLLLGLIPCTTDESQLYLPEQLQWKPVTKALRRSCRTISLE